MTRARAFAFHADSRQLPGITKSLDRVAERVAKHPDFRGLVCLEHDDDVRNEVIVITLWDGQGLDDTAAEAEASRRQIADAIDLGVSSRCYEVLRWSLGRQRLRACWRRLALPE